jgi:hypothetical protein
MARFAEKFVTFPHPDSEGLPRLWGLARCSVTAVVKGEKPPRQYRAVCCAASSVRGIMAFRKPELWSCYLLSLVVAEIWLSYLDLQGGKP